MIDYIRDPAEIYRRSFATIRAETDLDCVPPELRAVALRLIHACGMTDILADLRWSDDLPVAARSALAAGAPILTDARMVADGIIDRRLRADGRIVCLIDAPETTTMATAQATTRSAAAVDLWAPRLAGAVVAIGNAPTALFRLLELLDAGAPKPAAILAFPVGFVGAAESKAVLAADPRGVPFLTLLGRRGGSAMAAAAVNALSGEESS
jgi:precorrin-8X/cobalt-precorrin-8 methylmutase